MSQKQRREQILGILETQKFVTVRYLTHALHYSTATVNRDLNALAALGLVRRSYGGAEAVSVESLPPLPARQFYMQKEKRHNAMAAAGLVENGETLFLDGSTTVQHISPYLVDKRDLTVITNNMALAAELGKYDLRVICLGGEIVERPHVLGGGEAVAAAMRYRADKFFFSTSRISEAGEIRYDLLRSVMLARSREAYLLTDKAKIVSEVRHALCDFSALTGVISDFEFPEETKRKYPGVRFICSADEGK